eukprot:CAMPEP_0119498576 /NCGR_PEP_ID=MMETSP1344-20130328/21279_1 /TAXON_ID=236787 /ORGANISM="Florenciella parvula, Strain CCMP2471" /LENGTH=68 /DNA_ID=CAMNT_0007534465 /DNA_START=15 /DNA_END=218 /DNA_ORIENTATION=+
MEQHDILMETMRRITPQVTSVTVVADVLDGWVPRLPDASPFAPDGSLTWDPPAGFGLGYGGHAALAPK